MKKILGVLGLILFGFVVLFFQQGKNNTGQVQFELDREARNITQTGVLEPSPPTQASAPTKALFEVLDDRTKDGDQRVSAASLLIQSWTEKDKETAVQFILSSPFYSGATRVTEFEITLRALILESLAETSWRKEVLPELQKIAAFSESSFLSQRAELYRKWISGLGPNPKEFDEKVLTQILSRK